MVFDGSIQSILYIERGGFVLFFLLFFKFFIIDEAILINCYLSDSLCANKQWAGFVHSGLEKCHSDCGKVGYFMLLIAFCRIRAEIERKRRAFFFISLHFYFN